MTVGARACVCWCEREPACITCPVGVGDLLMALHAKMPMPKMHYCAVMAKKKKIKNPIMLFHSYSERVRGDEVALGGCCHGDDLNHCVA